ncbi:MAG: type II secretion system secretin GspD [Nitrospirae bacterium]|nr:type II secretion system secretin GspD [Nitrospirota bacterium]
MSKNLNKLSIMNHISIIAALLLLVFNGNVFAEPPKINEAAQVSPKNLTVPEPPPPVVTPQDPPPPVVSPQEAPIPANLPPNITQEQVKSFFSKQSSENFVILNFDDAELADVINTISSITGANFIVSPGLSAKITINSSKKIPVSEVLNVFESILEVNGISLVKSGDFFKIVSSAAAKQKPLEILKDINAGSVPYGDRPVTQIIPVRYVPAREVTAVLQPMLSQAGSIIPNPRNNLIIINDNASSIRRLLEVLAEIDIDVFQDKRLVFFQPQYSNAKTLSDDLTSILNALNYTKEEVVLVPIERINSLIIFSSSPDILRTVNIWIKKLDEDVMTGQNIFVYQVQNVKAQSLAEVLHSLYGGNSGTSAAPQRQTAAASEPSKQAAPVKAASSPVVQKPSSASPGSGASKVEITIFEPTNALVILSPPGIYRDIVNTIKKLDVYPKEVLIEVLVAEVNLTNDLQFGVQWSVLNRFSIEGDDNYTGLAQNRSGESPFFSLPPIIGENSGAASTLAGGLSYLLYRPDKIAAMIHSLVGNGRANILSSPRLLVRDQEEASIEVGSDIPTATNSSQSSDTTATVNQTIEYKTIGIKLKIKPSINDEKTVVLDIEQEVSDQLSNVTVGQQGFSYPSFSTRKTKTSIVVPDQQGIVIGGIIKEKKNKDYQGIPGLSKIPLLGYLFRDTKENVSKTELVIILTPHVITNKSETEMVKTDFLDKLKEVKDALKNSKGIYDIIPSEKPEPDPKQVDEQ